MCVVKSAALVSGFKYPSPTALPEAKQYRSEEHTSELQSLRHLVCRLLLEKKKNDLRLGASLRTFMHRMQTATDKAPAARLGTLARCDLLTNRGGDHLPRRSRPELPAVLER